MTIRTQLKLRNIILSCKLVFEEIWELWKLKERLRWMRKWKNNKTKLKRLKWTNKNKENSRREERKNSSREDSMSSKLSKDKEEKVLPPKRTQNILAEEESQSSEWREVVFCHLLFIFYYLSFIIGESNIIWMNETLYTLSNFLE